MTIQQLSLGQLVKLLHGRPDGERVIFDFCGLAPTGLTSYRGYHDQLAITWGEYDEELLGQVWIPKMTVKKLRDLLTDAVDKIFIGYNGGNFKMDYGTPLWVANVGFCGSIVVTGIADYEYQTVITTAYEA